MRWQFGLSASFHFLFVPLSLGLLLCMNILQTLHVVTRRSAPQRAARFWGRLFLLVWATGLITGYPLRWQLMALWDQYLQTAAPVFKEIFAIEGLIAPLMIGCVIVLIGLRAWLPAWVTMALGWLLLVFMGIQSFAILSINAWMQHPHVVSYDSSAWHVPSVLPLLLNETALHKGLHTLSAAMLSGAFCLLAISSHFMVQRKHLATSHASFQVAAWVGLGAVVCVLWSGHWSAAGVSKTQPMKFAAFEAHWQADAGPAPLVVWARPDEAHDVNRQELAIPYLMSLLETGDLSSPPGIIDLTRGIEHKLQRMGPVHHEPDPADRLQHMQLAGLDHSLELPGQDEERAWLRLRESVAVRMGPAWDKLSAQAQISQVARAARPPVAAVFMAFRVMVGSGLLCLAVCLLVFFKRDSLTQGHHLNWLRWLKWTAPLPWLAIISGWGVAEMGRQPWTIYEHLPTFQASSLPSLENGVLVFFAMLMAGAVLATAFMRLAKSIIATGPDAERWLDWGWAMPWLSRVFMRPRSKEGARLATPVRMDTHDEVADECHPPSWEKAA